MACGGTESAYRSQLALCNWNAQPRDKHQEVQTSARVILRQQPLFKCLGDEQLDALLPRGKVIHFGNGETMIRQGENGDSMFIIVEGEANVVAERNGFTRHVASIKAGDCFGEMSLLTGELRSATVVANSDCEVVEITKAVLGESLKENPELLAQLSELLAQRQLKTEDAFAGNKPAAEVARQKRYAASFLGKLWRVFRTVRRKRRFPAAARLLAAVALGGLAWFWWCTSQTPRGSRSQSGSSYRPGSTHSANRETTTAVPLKGAARKSPLAKSTSVQRTNPSATNLMGVAPKYVLNSLMSNRDSESSSAYPRLVTNVLKCSWFLPNKVFLCGSLDGLDWTSNSLGPQELSTKEHLAVTGELDQATTARLLLTQPATIT